MERPLNPFDPSRPISPSQFVGRQMEIGELEAALVHAKRGRPRHFLITGDRGAGKTSFLDYIRRRATSGNEGGEFNFIVIDFSVNRHTTRLDFARALQGELNSVLSAHAPFKEMLVKTWAFIQRFEAAGISYKSPGAELENHRDIYQSVADSLCHIVNKICSDAETGAFVSGFDGLLILIDEVDQSSSDLDVGAFLKYLLEQLNRKGCDKVIIGLAGLAISRDVLVKSHPSSLRIFDELPLGNLQRAEVDELLSEAELHVRNDGVEGFSFTEEARAQIFEFSGGHPHFVHQFGYSAFEKSCSAAMQDAFVVNRGHVLKGALEDRGALALIGDMYFQKNFEAFENNLEALSILDCLCEMPEQSLSVVELAQQVGLENIADTLSELADAGFLVNVKEKGNYRVRHSCFAYWLKARRPQLA